MTEPTEVESEDHSMQNSRGLPSQADLGAAWGVQRSRAIFSPFVALGSLCSWLTLAACTGTLSAQNEPDGNSPVSGSGGASMSGLGPRTEADVQLDAGRVVLRKLNQTEYNNTVQDLLGTLQRPGDLFPPDDVSVEGFDTVGLDLNFTSLYAEQAEKAAAQLASELMARPAADPARKRLLPCAPTADDADGCVSRTLAGFMRRAFRRPPAPDEVADMVGLAKEVRGLGGTPEEGLSAALQAVLLSPHFLYKVEIDAQPGSSELHPVNDYEFASRLSYFLWASMPDDALLDAADQQAFSKHPEEVVAQFTRMLEDPKSDRLISNFASEWLNTGATVDVAPDRELFPSFDDALRLSMRKETEAFFSALVRDALPLETLLTADFTFADARLAKHYGLDALKADAEPQRVSLAGSHRIGLLTQTSFLSTTSYPQRTSPVKRGAWVLEQLLCSPPPPPPPNVNTALEPPTPMENLTLREKFEQHRSNPACSGCHSTFDPVGMGLENFDAIGAFRTEDNGKPIDATGQLAGGESFDGATDLARVVAADERFVPCVMKQLMTYSVGRSFRESDAREYVEALGNQTLARGGSWQDALSTVVGSVAFSTRRGEAP
jgi:Protein of unknown function (DUF1592)/Protein of unknown function (DUF1588)/Protein of unknown function (DUF1595)/Protein of unknown function (DUF1587)/Protein of unknown function (DUF1585)